jgi:hypothetical protein
VCVCARQFHALILVGTIITLVGLGVYRLVPEETEEPEGEAEAGEPLTPVVSHAYQRMRRSDADALFSQRRFSQ